MGPSTVISARSLRTTLRAHADPENAAGAQRFFVGGVKTYGVHREYLDGFAREAVASLKQRRGVAAALRIADSLYRSRNMDEAALAARILERFGRDLGPAHFPTFDRWINFLNDWASCDSLCTQVVGPVIRDHPALIRRVLPWTRSKHRWRRRAAAVSLISLARTGERLTNVFRIADRLLGDPDDMVQKGVGWLLKEATRQRAGEVITYLIANRDRTTRLVLTYAAEKLGPAQRARVLGTTGRARASGTTGQTRAPGTTGRARGPRGAR
jgi:3-methyladenine DNA glycosylase AlkD